MRVVSLLPAATEIVADLGAADCLVGVSHACDYPPEVLSLPRVTRSTLGHAASPGSVDRLVRESGVAGESLYELDEERIAALRPDVILTQAVCDVCAVREEDVRALATRLRPAPTVIALAATSIEAVFDDIAAVATALEVDEEAEELTAGMRERMHRVHVTLHGAAAPRPRVAVIEWTDPIYAAGHWVPQMVRRAGAVDVAGRAEEASRTVTPDELAAANPELLVFAPCGYSLERAAEEGRRLLVSRSWRWAATARAWAIDANAFVSRPGPRLVTGVELFAQIFHPALFPPRLRGRAVALADEFMPS